MCCCDDNPPKFYGCIDRKARKPHRCSECRRTIARGEQYREHSGLWDGHFDTFRWCAHCEAAHAIADRAWSEYQRKFDRFHVEDLCFCFGGLWEAIEESFRDWAGYREHAHVARLIAGARRKWTIKRGPRKGELMAMPRLQPIDAMTEAAL